MSIQDEAYKQAIKALRYCNTKKGLYASCTAEGYRGVWARDSMIAFLGASLVGTKFKPVFKRSLTTLARNQSPHGQIPNAVGIYDTLRQSDITYTSIDSSLWFIIGAQVYAKTYREKAATQKKYGRAVSAALNWVECQDFMEEGLPAQLPTTDWQDAFPHKYGHTINTQALYYAALMHLGRKKEAAHVRELINGPKRPHLALFSEELGYYLPWAWKDHVGDREQEEWFDSLGNLLAIVTGLADRKKALSILNYIETEKINRPYPVRCMHPPIGRSSKLWKSYFSTSDARTPYEYLNGGVWPFIGAFYVAALVKAGQFKKAEEELENLRKANYLGITREWEFNEWLDGKHGKPRGSVYQAWSAGGYLFAHESVRQRRVPHFDY